MKSLLVLCLCISVHQVYAWGATGHETVGYVAMEFLYGKALEFVQTTLGPTYNESLGPAAPWADQIKSGGQYAWASVLHYVDALDSPPTACSVDYARDCEGDTCILGAISNYTTRVVDESLSIAEREEALKFLDHLIGDLGQPLHVENFEIGGNGVSVLCNGTTTNLHAVWDSGMLNIAAISKYGGSSQTLASELVSRIMEGEYAAESSEWIECSSTTATLRKRTLADDVHSILARDVEPLVCVTEWASDSNAINCDFLFTYDEYSDLCTSKYFDDAIPIVEKQLAKQGYRLATWLNVLFHDKLDC